MHAVKGLVHWWLDRFSFCNVRKTENFQLCNTTKFLHIFSKKPIQFALFLALALNYLPTCILIVFLRNQVRNSSLDNFMMNPLSGALSYRRYQNTDLTVGLKTLKCSTWISCASLFCTVFLRATQSDCPESFLSSCWRNIPNTLTKNSTQSLKLFWFACLFLVHGEP